MAIRKLLGVIGCACLLIGCGGDDDDDTSSSAKTSASSDPDDQAGDDETADEADPADDEGVAADESDESDATSGQADSTGGGGDGSATVDLDNGEQFEFSVLCALEPQEVAGSEILFTLVSYDEPVSLDVTQFSDDSFDGAANISLYDTATYDTVWEASSIYGTAIELTLDGRTVRGVGVFYPAGDIDAEGVEGELVATC